MRLAAQDGSCPSAALAPVLFLSIAVAPMVEQLGSLSFASSNGATTSLPEWVPIGALAAAAISAAFAAATFLSTREARRLDIETKRLGRDRDNNVVQATRAAEAEDSFSAVVSQIFLLLEDVQGLGALREEATISASRPLSLKKEPFTLRPSLYAVYRSRVTDYRRHLADLQDSIQRATRALESIRDNTWPVSPVRVSRSLLEMSALCDRLTTDADIRLTEVGDIVASRHREVDNLLAAMRLHQEHEGHVGPG